MSEPALPGPGSVRPLWPGPPAVVRRIRFVTEVPSGARVRRQFRQPRACLAVEEVAGPGDHPGRAKWPEPTDHFDAVFVPEGAGPGWHTLGEEWLAPPDHPEAEPAVAVECDGMAVRWRPGRALVLGRVQDPEALLDALTAFTFYEGELRLLERNLEVREADALADVGRAYKIRFRDRKHWPRFVLMIEELSRMRLTYARLEPRLAGGWRTLARGPRRLLSRLLRKANVAARLKAFGDRLEVCEDLYEGASDRVADYRWYVGGNWLEIGIIFLLSLEVVLMGVEIYLRSLE